MQNWQAIRRVHELTYKNKLKRRHFTCKILLRMQEQSKLRINYVTCILFNNTCCKTNILVAAYSQTAHIILAIACNPCIFCVGDKINKFVRRFRCRKHERNNIIEARQPHHSGETCRQFVDHHAIAITSSLHYSSTVFWCEAESRISI